MLNKHFVLFIELIDKAFLQSESPFWSSLFLKVRKIAGPPYPKMAAGSTVGDTLPISDPVLTYDGESLAADKKHCGDKTYSQ